LLVQPYSNLEDDIVHQLIPDEWEPERVHSFRAIYTVVDLIRFRANLANLRKKLAAELNRAVEDDNALHHDESLVHVTSHSAELRWDGSAAQRFLKEDIDQQQGMAPATLQASRSAYAGFDAKVFRKHVHQEKRSRLEAPYWAKKKEQKKKKKTKADKAASAKKDDECEAFLRNLPG
jgi:hypothetical protein